MTEKTPQEQLREYEIVANTMALKVLMCEKTLAEAMEDYNIACTDLFLQEERVAMMEGRDPRPTIFLHKCGIKNQTRAKYDDFTEVTPEQQVRMDVYMDKKRSELMPTGSDWKKVLSPDELLDHYVETIQVAFPIIREKSTRPKPSEEGI